MCCDVAGHVQNSVCPTVTLFRNNRVFDDEQMEGEDYVLLNNRVYELLEAWYGGGPRFKRWVISLGTDVRSELTVELFPVK